MKVKEITLSLKEFCAERSQVEAAEILNRTQGAIFQMLRDNRQVYIICHVDGTYSAYEIKRFNKPDVMASNS